MSSTMANKALLMRVGGAMLVHFLLTLNVGIAYSHQSAAHDEPKECIDVLNEEWQATEKYVWRVLCESDNVDFIYRTFLSQYINPKSGDWPESRRISGAFVTQIISEPTYSTYLSGRELSINNVWVDGSIYIDNVEADVGLAFTHSKIEALIFLDKSTLNRLAFTASELEGRVQLTESRLHKGLYVNASILYQGLSVATSEIGELIIDGTDIHPSGGMLFRGRDYRGRIYERNFDEGATSIFIDESVVDKWRMDSVSVRNVMVSSLEAGNIYLNGLLPLEAEKHKKKPTLALTGVSIEESCRIGFVLNFDRTMIFDADIDKILSLDFSRVDEVLVINVKTGDLLISSSKSSSASFTNIEVEDDFSVFDDPEKKIDEFYSNFMPELLARYKREAEKVEGEKGRLSIGGSEVGSLLIRKEDISDLTLNSLNIRRAVAFYLDEPNYDDVRLGSVEFDSLYIANSDRASKDMAFLAKDSWPSMHEYIQFARIYRELGMEAEADDIYDGGT